MSQNKAILKALKRGQRLTVLIALRKLNCYALSQRIGELKRAGIAIASQMIRLPNGKRVAEYRIGRGK